MTTTGKEFEHTKPTDRGFFERLVATGEGVGVLVHGTFTFRFGRIVQTEEWPWVTMENNPSSGPSFSFFTFHVERIVGVMHSPTELYHE